MTFFALAAPWNGYDSSGQDLRKKAVSDEGASRIRMIDVSEFNEKCLKLVDEVARRGSEFVITRNGRPVSRLVPFHKKPKSLFGIDTGRFEILRYVILPVNVEWEAQTGRPWDGDQELPSTRTSQRGELNRLRATA